MFEKEYEILSEWLFNESHQIVGDLTKLAETTKQYYKETESEEYKELFKILNKSYCDAAMLIINANADVAVKQLGVRRKYRNEKITAEGS